MGESKTIILNQDTMNRLLERAHKCFMCWWIHEDFVQHKKLTGWPTDSMGAGTFPVEGKLQHLKLEGFTV